MKQAILITAYKNLNHLKDIINFFDDNYSIYIHIDSKSSITASETSCLRLEKNVVFVSRKYKVNWGGINHLKSILLLINEAVKDHNIEYCHCISGEDYPVKTCTEIKEFLYNNRGKEFLEYFEMPAKIWPDGGMDRILYYNLYDLINAKSNLKYINKIIALQKKIKFSRKIKNGFPKLYGGSTWWTLSSNCLKYVIDFLKKNPSFIRRFKHTFCSEEMFFQTIIMSSPFKEKVVNDNLRFIIWEARDGYRPATLNETDYQNILESNKFFARKFEHPKSEFLLMKLKKAIADKSGILS